ncbi:Ubiquitin-like modifier-activating enzyme ATG7 [Auxenochlorella protothecoides]|uniref:Ubiquitin-like modifier-activating enzyme ATG7 n=1 Tax=Auxenochlorella protothecoides TaxID=3075 RepID=A0A087SIM3_AUXPR|nr:Ubiquitin-like modifier-activating enzyme ATG7 [Auxenochlorella protothecoides]KFM25577.1 Ubiquitin-like modifier-activating enzyme ATG7 [Auxenochlorella protothecoides]
MVPLLYFQTGKWVLGLGWLGFAFWAVYNVPGGCANNQRVRALRAILYSFVGLFLVIVLMFLLGYNLLGSYEPNARWQSRLGFISKCLGCYDVVTDSNLMPDDHDAPLEELASTFARFFGCVDLEKSDLVAGVVLTGLLQTHQRRSALEREATRRRGVSGGKKAQVPGPMPTLPPSSHSWDEVQGLVDRYCSSVAPGCPRCQVDQSQSTSKDDALQECMEHADDEQLPPRGVQALGGIPAAPVQDVAEAGGDSDFQGRSGDGSAGGGGSTPSSQASSSEAAAGVLRDWDGPFLRWVTAVAAGCSTYVTPSHWAGEEARAAGVDPDEAARASAGAPQPASQAEVDDAAFAWWFTWSYWRNRIALALSLYPRKKVAAAAYPPLQQKIAEDKEALRHYVGARKTLDVPDEDFIYCNFTDQALGTTPYNIVLDRTVVLSIRGSSSVEDLLTDVMDRPVQINNWLPADLTAAHPDLGEVRAHVGMYSAAKAVLRDLDSHRLLDTLLTGRPPASEECEREVGRYAPDARDRALCHAQHRLCAEGWMVVALASTRLTKLRVLTSARSAALRRLPRNKVFYQPRDIPEEALRYVLQYFEGKCSYKHLYLPMYPAGRVMHLRRVEREKGSRAWDAVWVSHCCLIDEGILVSRHQSSDHSIARLRNVFAELAGKDVPELAGADGGEDLSAIDVAFWAQLGENKLHDLRLDEGPISFAPTLTASQFAGIPGFVTASPGSLSLPPAMSARGLACLGQAFVYNTVEKVTQSDRKALTAQAASDIWACIQDGSAVEQPSLMLRPILLTHCDLKHSKYIYCCETERPSASLRPLLLLAAARWKVRSLDVLCLRQRQGRSSAQGSIVLGVDLPGVDLEGSAPAGAGGWEVNSRGKPGPRVADLAAAMDPKRLAASAVDLNLRLMRWRAVPSLEVGSLSSQRCLLLGAGTLGCSVARTLLGWGVRRLTLVDNARVSFSNPVRQSLYTFEDCLGGGVPKAQAAAEALTAIFPGVDARGLAMSVPMPGHVATPDEEAEAAEATEELRTLIEEHDIVFLLMDTRESRWLPTLLGAAARKLVVNAALGFDGYLVMRHGLPAGAGCAATPAATEGDVTAASPPERGGLPACAGLGCYFCNDVVAPVDSTADLSLDQQVGLCTVARPGLSAIAGALAVELAMAVCMTGSASRYCTACSPAVLSSFARTGTAFVIQSLRAPSTLEDLTGLTQLHADSEAVLALQGSESEEEGLERADGEEDDWHEI